MKVTFVLPCVVDCPVGGFKVIYEYASRLSQRGHFVTVAHRKNVPASGRRKQRLREMLMPWTKKTPDNQAIEPWFFLPPEVNMTVVPKIGNKTVPEADVIIATAWQTAAWVSNVELAKGKKYYLIQHDESQFDPADVANATWRLPLHKIVIAKWLKEKVVRLGETAAHIPNGMDLTFLRVENPIDARAACVGMLYHQSFDWKGSGDGLEAIIIAKKEHPALEAVLFGTEPRPSQIPAWIEYHHLPSPAELCALYNRCSVFLQPSWTEGWGLTATEAMACGCTLVTTDNGGSCDYAEDGVTALIAPPKQPVLLAAQIRRLLQDDLLRRSLAQNGCLHVQQYAWTAAVDRFERLLSEGASPLAAEPREG